MAIPRILFLGGAQPHAHDYGVDNLLRGFARLQAEGLVDVLVYPQAPHRHMGLGEGRDTCRIDSDGWAPYSLAWPVSQPSDLAPRVVRMGASYDVVIVASPHMTEVLIDAAPKLVGLNYGDTDEDLREPYGMRCGRALDAYWQRENPPEGSHWLPLSVPLERVRPVLQKPRHPLTRLFYQGSNHRWGDAGPRRAMERSLRAHVPPGQLFFRLYEDQEQHAPPEVYREWLWHADVSCVWNSWRRAAGAPVEHVFEVWDSNRLWESIALGCAVVCERPPAYAAWGLPEMIVMAPTPEEIGPLAAHLLTNPVAARQHAQALQDSMLMDRHLSEHRACAILRSVGIEVKWKAPRCRQ